MLTRPLSLTTSSSQGAAPAAVAPLSPAAEAVTLRLLVVDPEPEVCRLVREGAGPRFATIGAASAAEALQLLKQSQFDVVLLDAVLPGNAGLTLLHEITAFHPRTDVVVMTGYSTASAGMDAMRAGANDYLTKPFSEEDLHSVLERAGQRLRRDFESRRLRERLRTDKGMGPLVGTSPAMERVYRILSKVALSSHPALILGESGTGKEAVAQAIHSMGASAANPFVVVDCAAPAPSRVESGLFGHARGAVAGAARAREGLLMAAGDGTVFLDEVGELPLEVQSKLLRVLQERWIRPVGAPEPVRFSARVLAASSGELITMVEQGKFRKDLYFRLNVMKLMIPPLRERRQDIPMLAQHFLEKVRPGGGSHSFSDESLRLLCDYDWPGNVRELQTAVERMFSMSSGPVLHSVDLPTQLQDFRAHLQANVAAAEQEQTVEAGPAVVSIVEMEKQAILNTVRQLNGDKLLAAKLLGIGKTTLYRKLKEYGLDG